MQLTKIKKNPAAYLFLVLMTLHPGLVWADEAFGVESASTRLDGDVYFLNTVFRIDLPDYITTALSQGFELPLVMEIDVYKHRSLWFDSRAVYIKQQYKIHYHLLLDAVSIFDVNAGSRSFYSTIDEAVEKLSVLIKYPMLDNNNLQQDKTYQVRLRFGIDISELPIPLKSSSLWKNDWALSSDWYEWMVNP